MPTLQHLFRQRTSAAQHLAAVQINGEGEIGNHLVAPAIHLHRRPRNNLLVAVQLTGGTLFSDEIKEALKYL